MAGARVTGQRVVGACASSSSGFQRRLDGVEVVGAGELARRGDHASRAAAGRVDEMNLADGALLNETAWSALVGMAKRSARDAAKTELATE